MMRVHVPWSGIALVLLASCALSLSGCLSPPRPPTTGVRMRAGLLAMPFYPPGSGPPVEGVADSGYEQPGSYGGGSPTSETSIEGDTDQFGIDDHPEAETNALWSFTWNFTDTVVPNCGIATFTDNKLFNPPEVNIDYGDCVGSAIISDSDRPVSVGGDVVRAET